MMLFQFLSILFESSLWNEVDVYFYFTILALFVYTLYLNRGRLFKKIKEINHLEIFLLVIIIVAGIFIRYSHIQTTAHITDSVWEYLQGARYFVQRGVIYKCYGPSFNECAGPAPVSHPAMYSLINGLLYKITGFNPVATTYLGFLFSIGTLILSFVAIYEYLDDKYAALLGSAILSLIPLHVTHSVMLDGTTAILSVFSAFFVLLASVNLLKKDDWKSWAFFFVSLLFAVSFRWENILFFPIGFLILLIESENPVKSFKQKISNWKIQILILICFILLLSPTKGIYTVWISRPSNLISSFGLSFFQTGLEGFQSNFLSSYSFFGAFVLSLLPFAFLENKKRTLLGIFWFSSFTLVYASFRYGFTSRYMVNTLPPLVLLGSIGLKGLVNRLQNFTGRKLGRIVTIAVLTIFLLSSFLFVDYPRVERKGEVDKLLRFANYTNNKPIMFPDTNTLLAFLTYTDNRVAATPMTLDILKAYGYSEFYFLENFRCEGRRDICQSFVERGRLVKKSGNWRLYHINHINQEFRIGEN